MQRSMSWGWNSMGKRYEAALKVKPVLQKGAQSLSDAEALTVKAIYGQWAAGDEVKTREKRIYGERLYRCRQAHTTQADWTPDLTPDLWAIIDEENEGTIANPIPAVSGMEYEYGKYYLDPEDGLVYLCYREDEAEGGKIVLYALPHNLIGNYFILAEV